MKFNRKHGIMRIRDDLQKFVQFIPERVNLRNSSVHSVFMRTEQQFIIYSRQLVSSQLFNWLIITYLHSTRNINNILHIGGHSIVEYPN